MHHFQQLFKFLVAVGPLVKALTHAARRLLLDVTVILLSG